MCAAFAKTVEVSTLGTAVAISLFQIHRAHRAIALVPPEKSMKFVGDSPQLAGLASQYQAATRAQASTYAIGPVPTLVPQPSNFHCTNRFRSEPAPIVLKTPRNRRWLKRRNTKRSVQPRFMSLPILAPLQSTRFRTIWMLALPMRRTINRRLETAVWQCDLSEAVDSKRKFNGSEVTQRVNGLEAPS